MIAIGRHCKLTATIWKENLVEARISPVSSQDSKVVAQNLLILLSIDNNMVDINLYAALSRHKLNFGDNVMFELTF